MLQVFRSGLLFSCKPPVDGELTQCFGCLNRTAHIFKFPRSPVQVLLGLVGPVWAEVAVGGAELQGKVGSFVSSGLIPWLAPGQGDRFLELSALPAEPHPKSTQVHPVFLPGSLSGELLGFPQGILCGLFHAPVQKDLGKPGQRMGPEVLVLFSRQPAEAFLEELFGHGVITADELNPGEVVEDIAGQGRSLVFPVKAFTFFKHLSRIEGPSEQEQELAQQQETRSPPRSPPLRWFKSCQTCGFPCTPEINIVKKLTAECPVPRN